MNYTSNEQIKLTKLHTKPKKGYKLGTATASFNKLKAAAVPDSNEYDRADDKDNTDFSISQDPHNIYLNGKHGELIILYRASGLIEVWDWFPTAYGSKPEGDTIYVQTQAKISNSVREYEGSRYVTNFTYLRGDLNSRMYFLIISRNNGNYFFEVHSLDKTSAETALWQDLQLPTYFNNKGSDSEKFLSFTIKVGDEILVIASNEGFIYSLTLLNDKYVPSNSCSKLASLRKSSSLPIINKYRLGTKVSDEDLLLETSCSKNIPVFDVVGSWLVYSPTKAEYEHIKTVGTQWNKVTDKSEQLDPLITSDLKELSRSTIFTPVKLPRQSQLLNRVLNSISNSALDGLFKLSGASSIKLREYLNKKEEVPESPKPSTNLSKKLISMFHTTASTIQKSTRGLTPNDNQLIKVVDLINDRVLAVFKAQGGVSNLSLSPYDLQLVHVNLRGDHIYMWDLYKLPKEVSFIGKFIRGKTSAVIDEISWFINSYGDSSINCGFGCITRNTGSVHWYNINYLCGSLAQNSPKGGDEEILEGSTKENFMDSWLLPSYHGQHFMKIPSISNDDRIRNNSYLVNQLAVVDSQQNLRLVSTLNGNHSYYYELPLVPTSMTAIPKVPTKGQHQSKEEHSDRLINYLSQAEIETCSPYDSLSNNENMKFAIFDCQGESDFKMLMRSYVEFGNDIPEKVINFNNASEKLAENDVDETNNCLIDNLGSDLVINQGDES